MVVRMWTRVFVSVRYCIFHIWLKLRFNCFFVIFIGKRAFEECLHWRCLRCAVGEALQYREYLKKHSEKEDDADDGGDSRDPDNGRSGLLKRDARGTAERPSLFQVFPIYHAKVRG